jgi:hypothetical protein
VDKWGPFLLGWAIVVGFLLSIVIILGNLFRVIDGWGP